MPTRGNREVRYDSFKDTRHLQPILYVIVHSAIALPARKCERRDLAIAPLGYPYS